MGHTDTHPSHTSKFFITVLGAMAERCVALPPSLLPPVCYLPTRVDAVQQVAEEHGLEVSLGLPAAGAVPMAAPAQAAPIDTGDDLSKRLADLRGR